MSNKLSALLMLGGGAGQGASITQTSAMISGCSSVKGPCYSDVIEEEGDVESSPCEQLHSKPNGDGRVLSPRVLKEHQPTELR